MKRSKIVSKTKLGETARPDPLRAAFQFTVDALKRHRADLLQSSSIDAYVNCDWLAWRGGSLMLTTVGENICAQLRKESRALAGL
jgi:hypothetical protein